ncbi:MAG: dihydroorotase [Bacteroidota bacterium]
MPTLLILNGLIVNEGQIFASDIFIKDGYIETIAPGLSSRIADKVIDAAGLHIFPGVIDDQVHFREPGLTHKANIFSESRAAVAGGTTSFMEMPNTNPPALTQELLADKYEIAANTSAANYSFFMGAGNNNIDEVLATDPKTVCGIKIFMGSSTGNMLVDHVPTLERIFKESKLLIAVHCEDEQRIRSRTAEARALYNDEIPPEMHPVIRDEEACYLSSSLAVGLAKKHNTRLHVLHISTEKELALFDNTLPLAEKRITAEVCVHHLWFPANDYAKLGNKIKCNPAIKAEYNREALWPALLNNHLDIIATDHAPHTAEEKNQPYLSAPSGLPLVQHSLQMMIQAAKTGRISYTQIAEKMAHAPAVCFNIEKRGFIREGYFADLAIVNTESEYTVSEKNILYKCGWSPLEGPLLGSTVDYTIVSGKIGWEKGNINENCRGMRLKFKV